MGDYISREAAIEKIRGACCTDCGGSSAAICRFCDFENAVRLIKRLPAADVEPVRRGRWEMVYPDGTFCKGEALRTMYALLVCSECGKTFELMRMGKPRYCICGAKMDLEEENA